MEKSTVSIRLFRAEGKVLISMLVSTGARIGEVRLVQVSDVDFKRTPVFVYFRKTKTGVSRLGFF